MPSGRPYGGLSRLSYACPTLTQTRTAEHDEGAPPSRWGASRVLLALARPVSQPLIQRLPSHPSSRSHRRLRRAATHRSHRRSTTPTLNLSQNLLRHLNLTTQTIQLQQAQPLRRRLDTHRFSFQVRPSPRDEGRACGLRSGARRAPCGNLTVAGPRQAAGLGDTGPQGLDLGAVRESEDVRTVLSDGLDDRTPAASGDTDAAALGIPPRAVAGDSDALNWDSDLF
nr:MAG TPA: hypothetical protein [Caudoviricetes sp.]